MRVGKLSMTLLLVASIGGCDNTKSAGVPVPKSSTQDSPVESAREGYTRGLSQLENELADDDAEGRGEILRAAQAGLADAQYSAGACFALGLGGPTDLAQAFVWFKKAAALGQRDAQYRVAHELRTGSALGTTGDLAAARELYLAAAQKGHGPAQFALGVTHHLGWGGPVSLRDAVKWYTIAAEHNHPLAVYALVQLYMDGSAEAPPDLETAYMWLLIAERLHHLFGDSNLRDLRGREKSILGKLDEGARQKAAQRAKDWLSAHPYSSVSDGLPKGVPIAAKKVDDGKGNVMRRVGPAASYEEEVVTLRPSK